METVKITLTGTTPLLLHADNIEWADAMEEWKNNADNRKASKPGDDRTPPWRWIGALTYDDPETGLVALPSDYIMASTMGGASQVPLGKGKLTFKSLSQSGLICTEMFFPLLVNGKTISMQDINACKKLKTFKENAELAKVLGFSLFTKRAKVGQAKHIRVRPRFDKWSVTGEMLITDDQITKPILQHILTLAGRLKGMGDWRPGAGHPGPWGMFKAVVD